MFGTKVVVNFVFLGDRPRGFCPVHGEKLYSAVFDSNEAAGLLAFVSVLVNVVVSLGVRPPWLPLSARCVAPSRLV